MSSKSAVLSVPLAVTFAVISCIFPLSCYAVSLAIFGLPHIYCELRYLNERFAHCVKPHFKYSSLLLVSLIASVNFIAIFIALPHHLEMILSIALLLVLISCLYIRAAVCVLILFTLIGIVLINPLLAIVVLAFTHNLTPWGFLIDQRADRHAALIFVVLPCLVMMGSYLLSQDFFLYSSAHASMLLSHYIPVIWQKESLVRAIFATAVYLQLIHYDATIRILPGLMQHKFKISWPVLLFFIITPIGFVMDYAATRSFYAVFASFHAWLEIPLLMLLAGLWGVRSTSDLSSREGHVRLENH